MTSMPDRVELCTRIRDGHPCKGLIFRPAEGLVYCPACGGNEAGVVYALPDPVIKAERERAERLIDDAFERWDKALSKSSSQVASRRDLVFYREVIHADLRSTDDAGDAE